MATITWSNESIELGGRGLITLTRAFQYVLSIFGRQKTTNQDMTALETAMTTLKLAAEPGENYAALAARMKLEAETYRDFLMNPKPIGKISLIVKETDPNSKNFSSPRKQIEIHDPVEGRAASGYGFDRSDTKVLEFILYDTEGSPLFAITRTYSNWIGSREFNLGLDRVFCLNMVEDSPGRVRVHANFRMAAAREGARDRETTLEPVAQIPARVGNVESGRSIFEFRPFGRRLAYLLVLQCIVISLICSTVIWVATGRAMSREESLSKGATHLSASAQPTDSSLPGGRTMDYAISIGTSSSSNDDASEKETTRKIQLRSVQKAKRLAKVEGFSIYIDNDSCKSNERSCLELLSTVQKRVHSNLGSLSLRVYTPDQANEGVEPARLIVSYNPIDTLHGQVHLTLYDQQGELWDDKGNLPYAAIAEPSAVDTYCEEASSKILWEIITAKIRVNSNPQDGKDVSASD